MGYAIKIECRSIQEIQSVYDGVCAKHDVHPSPVQALAQVANGDFQAMDGLSSGFSFLPYLFLFTQKEKSRNQS